MDTKGNFLTAHWGNLLLLNYAVKAEVLLPHLPQGCTLDLWQGSPHVSLVAFQFTNTRVFGIRWPFYTNFPELNLRFYINYRGRRGVCFIREYVPSSLVAWIARSIYNEPYLSAKMWEQVQKDTTQVRVDYGLERNGHRLRFQASAKNTPHTPGDSSIEHFFKEHDLGVGRDRAGRTLTYEVSHPVWRVFPLESYSVEIAAKELYGEKFGFLSTQKPTSVVLAEGSEIAVYPHHIPLT